MGMVRRRSFRIGTLWYLFEASTIVVFPDATSVSWWNAYWMWCVSQTALWLNTCKSTVRCDLLFFFRAVNIRWHLVTVSPTGTACRTSSLTPLYNNGQQCRETEMGLWTAICLDFRLTWSSEGRPFIKRNVWNSQMVEVLDRYLSTIQIWKTTR